MKAVIFEQVCKIFNFSNMNLDTCQAVAIMVNDYIENGFDTTLKSVLYIHLRNGDIVKKQYTAVLEYARAERFKKGC